ncbi:MAG TPA: beta-ketoacyl synthase N-terminal-like domain-containing protein [Micromonosporaceae bacterium]|nr:beta-ketoacyl synthase N-terminal-like domain-containing protein [Micromonosporaceae bacterium]
MTWPVAGAGAVAAVGSTAAEVFAALCDGRTGRALLRAFDPDSYRAQYAYEIDDRPDRTDVPARATAWLLRAVAEAVGQAGVGEDLTDVPVLIGTGLRELRSAELAWHDGAPFDLGRLHFGPALRERFGAVHTYTFANACSASLYALALAADLLADGECDRVVVAGVDALTESMFGLLDRAQMAVPDRVAAFAATRGGTLLGEGAAAVVLARTGAGATALGRLRSVGINCDAYHATAPDPPGMAAAMRDAHERAGVLPRDISLVLLHGTGTPLNDQAEAEAVGDVFGPDVKAPLMMAIKPATGHTSGGSGLLSLVVALQVLASGRVPAAAGPSDPLAAAAGFRFTGGLADPGTGPRLAQVNAFGFGGVNAVAVVEGPAP